MSADMLTQLREMAREVEKHAVPEIRAPVNPWVTGLIHWPPQREKAWPHRVVHIVMVPPRMEAEVRALDHNGAIRWVDASRVFDGLEGYGVVLAQRSEWPMRGGA